LVLPFAEASTGILIATDHQVAVLGMDAFEVRPDGLATVAIHRMKRFCAITSSRTLLINGSRQGAPLASDPNSSRWLL